jgi:inner membrane protein
VAAPVIFGGAVAAAYGGLFPDVDAPNSSITRGYIPGAKRHDSLKAIGFFISLPLRLVSMLVGHLFGHRGATHSLIGALVTAALAVLVALLIGAPLYLAGAFTLGVLTHIACDSATISGCPWLWPWRKTKYHLRVFGQLRTGSKKEQYIRIFLFVPLTVVCYFVAVFALMPHS